MKTVLVFSAISFLISTSAFAATEAVAKITGTGNTPIEGEVRFVEGGHGMQVTARIRNAPPGKHGFHIHEKGSCDDGGLAAGGHYNPHNATHGYLPKDGSKYAHAGDFGNLVIDENGEGSLELHLHVLSLSKGDAVITNRAVIIHEKPDDFGQPTGNAGARIACGVIELVAA